MDNHASLRRFQTFYPHVNRMFPRALRDATEGRRPCSGGSKSEGPLAETSY